MKINKMQAFLAGMMLERAIKDKEHRGLDLLGVWAILGLPGLAIAFEIAGFIAAAIMFAILVVIISIREWLKTPLRVHAKNAVDATAAYCGFSFIVVFYGSFVIGFLFILASWGLDF